MSDERLLSLIQTHLGRYPASEFMDVYKLLHQATFGPGHLIADKNAAREWLEREMETLVPSIKEPLVENIHPDGQMIRLHLRPYRAYEGKIKWLVDAFVRSAGQAGGTVDVMKQRWQCFEESCQPDGFLTGRFPRQELLMFGRIRSLEGWPAVHHSPTYQAAYKPYYRVLTRAEAEALCRQINAPFEVV
jgi:hypothetical protein